MMHVLCISLLLPIIIMSIIIPGIYKLGDSYPCQQNGKLYVDVIIISPQQNGYFGDPHESGGGII